MWGMSGFPMAVSLNPMVFEEASQSRRRQSHNDDDPHLRSAQALNGYHIQTSQGVIGHVTDFIMDDKSWAIGHMIVKTGPWFWGKEIAILPKQINYISYDDFKVFVNVTKEAIIEAPEYHVPPLGEAYHDTENFK